MKRNKLQLATRALLLVDLQNDFCPGGALPVPEGDHVIPLANRVQEGFDIVVASQDWHPPDHASFAANHPGRKIGERIELKGLEQILWPVHCVQDTSGAQFVPDLHLAPGTRIFRKGTDRLIDSYSAFFDNGHLKSTGLENYLKKLGVQQLFVLGLATDYCVKYTALDARSLGFETFLIEDGCRAVNLNPADGKRALEEMKAQGVQVMQSWEVV